MEVTVYYFSAPWCGPCKLLGPIVEQLTQEITSVNFVKVNTDTDTDLVTKYNVRSVPTLVITKDSIEIDRRMGVTQKTALTHWILEKAAS